MALQTAQNSEPVLGKGKLGEGLIDCSKVAVHSVDGKGASAFALVDIKKGEVVEKGIMRRLPRDFDGMANEYVFTWSDDIPNTTWAFGSGCATFYNTAVPEMSNTSMERIFDEDRFVIRATKDIAAGEVSID